ncbi:hypothetical protein EYF80_044632 [Liparis tanakae]|uniref:Uncharacterized protein n=1 Tax=Liparis tanakae TaxID=230148 RepID=A0A4Z2FXX3_9TELE|nr:hypothetical protein EYF80_044632 [Liparis tanakae]
MWEVFSPLGGVSSPNVQPGSPFHPRQQGYTAPVGDPSKPHKSHILLKPQPQQGVLQTKAGMWDIFTPGGGRSELNVQPGFPTQPPQIVYKPKKSGYQPSVYKLKPKQAGYQLNLKPLKWVATSSGYPPQQGVLPGSPLKPQQPSYLPKPQLGVLQTKAGMWDIFAPAGGAGPNEQPGSPPKSQKPNLRPELQKPKFPPQQGVLQTKAGMWDIFPPNGGSSGPNKQPGSPLQLPKIVYKPLKSGYRPSVYQLKPKPKQPGYQPSIYQLKPLTGYLPKPQLGVLQTKAGMWDIFSNDDGGSGPNVQPRSPSPAKPQKLSFQLEQEVLQIPDKVQPRSLSPTQQGVLHTKPGMWDIVSSVGISSPNGEPQFPYQPIHQPGYQPSLSVPQSGHQRQEPIHQSGYQPIQEPSYQPIHQRQEPIHQSGYQPIHQRQEPIHQRQEPIQQSSHQSGYQPIHQHQEPIHHGYQPIHQRQEPIHQRVGLPVLKEEVLQEALGAQEGRFRSYSSPDHQGATPLVTLTLMNSTLLSSGISLRNISRKFSSSGSITVASWGGTILTALNASSPSTSTHRHIWRKPAASRRLRARSMLPETGPEVKGQHHHTHPELISTGMKQVLNAAQQD